MLNVIDLRALDLDLSASEPFQWARLPRTFARAADATALASTFPREVLRPASRSVAEAGGKSYHMLTATVMDGTGPAEPLPIPPLWEALVNDITDARYRAALGRASGTDLSGADIEVRLCEYPADGWLSPHTDREDKMLTHVLYFNPTWDDAWGGHLEILNSEDPDDVYQRVAPVLDSSVVMVRSDRSWHSVGRVTSDAAQPRRSLLVHFSVPRS